MGAVGLDRCNNVKSENLPKLGATVWTSVSRDANFTNIARYWTLLGFLGASSILICKNFWPSNNLEARYKKFPALKFDKSNELRPRKWVIVLGSLLSLKNTITSGIVGTVSCDVVLGGGGDSIPTGWKNFKIKPKRYNIGAFMMSISPPLLDYIRCKVCNIPMDVQNGVFLEKVYPGSPASDAGLQTNDIIVKINGIPITSSNEVDDMVQKGKPFRVEVVRGKRKLEITVTPEPLIIV